MDEREEHVLAAAREERAARKDLERSVGPTPHERTEAEDAAQRRRLQRWRLAARTLVEALQALKGGVPERQA